MRLGGQHNAKSIMVTVDFHEIEQLQHTDQWDKAGLILADAALKLEHSGAHFIVLCTNTMHKVVPLIQSAIQIPILHIADATAQQIVRRGLTRIGLLGTRFTMEQDFYKSILVQKYGLEVLIPDLPQRELIHRVIFDELCQGVIREDSRAAYAEIIRELEDQGAEGVILGCTEITLLVKPEDSRIPQFDTTVIHVERAIELALTQ
jgi:aspartate racemase